MFPQTHLREHFEREVALVDALGLLGGWCFLWGVSTGFPSDPQGKLEGMSLGLSPLHQDLLTTTTSFCEPLVAPDSIYGLLHRECHRLFLRDRPRICVGMTERHRHVYENEDRQQDPGHDRVGSGGV